MQPYQNRVRRMRPPRKSARRLGRSTDGTRRNYYKPSPLAAEAALAAARPENQIEENQS